MLTLFRGDDMSFAEFDRKVCVRFNTCQDLTGWSAKFCLFDNVKYTDDISPRIWTFGYTSEETQVFPLGKTFGKLLVLDQSGRIRQMAKVEVEVVNLKLEPSIAGTIAISVDNIVADYANIGNKPILNGKVIEGEHDSNYYGLVDKESLSNGMIPISKLLFVADGDSDNLYQIHVEMRDDGAGGVLPVLALDPVPRGSSVAIK